MSNNKEFTINNEKYFYSNTLDLLKYKIFNNFFFIIIRFLKLCYFRNLKKIINFKNIIFDHTN